MPRSKAAGGGPGASYAKWLDAVAVISIALVLRVVYLLQIESIPLFVHLAGDARTYDEWAQRIVAGAWLGNEVFYQAPLYPYFLAVWQSLFGHNLWAIRVVQIVLGAISCGLIYFAGDKLFGRRAGLAAGLLLAFYAPAIFFDGLIEKSILDLFLTSCLLGLLVRLDGDSRSSLWLATGAVLGLLCLSRENALIFVPVLACCIAVQFSAQAAAQRIRWTGLFLAGLLLVLLPVGVRNLAVGGEFKLTTSQFGPNFFIGNNAAADGTYGSVRKAIGEVQLEGSDARRLAERVAGRRLTAGEVSDFWLRRALDDIKAQPGKWLGLLGKKWLLVWNKREIEDSDDFYIYRSWSWLLNGLGAIYHFGVLAPLAALGVALTYSRWRRLWLFYAMILALAGGVAMFYVFGRYRFPLVPFLALFAGAGAAAALELYKNKHWGLLAGGVAAALCAAGIVNWPVSHVSGPGAAGYNNLSNAYLKQGRIDEATRVAIRALEVDPSYGVAHYNLGNLYSLQGKFADARGHFESALRMYPNYADAHSNYGQLLAEQGDLEGGIRHFRKAVELNPTLPRGHLNLGVALAKQEKLDEAIPSLQQAVRLSPGAPEPSYFLGNVYAAQNRYGEAVAAFQKALQINPGFVPAHQSLARLFGMIGKTREASQHYHEAVRLMKQQNPDRGMR
ncbi:MAG TPA: tetratricopeptide repeat protein [Candidatus Binatia bacterium]|nr:tetratricopeptide repeat protein [Candidatus Binatia bacterium]